MNPIDNDRPWIDFVRQKQSPTDVGDGKQHNQERIAQKSNDTQLIGLLSLIKSAPEISSQNERINQIKTEIHANTYGINLDSLVENIMASDYEL